MATTSFDPRRGALDREEKVFSSWARNLSGTEGFGGGIIRSLLDEGTIFQDSYEPPHSRLSRMRLQLGCLSADRIKYKEANNKLDDFGNDLSSDGFIARLQEELKSENLPQEQDKFPVRLCIPIGMNNHQTICLIDVLKTAGGIVLKPRFFNPMTGALEEKLASSYALEFEPFDRKLRALGRRNGWEVGSLEVLQSKNQLQWAGDEDDKFERGPLCGDWGVEFARRAGKRENLSKDMNKIVAEWKADILGRRPDVTVTEACVAEAGDLRDKDIAQLNQLAGFRKELKSPLHERKSIEIVPGFFIKLEPSVSVGAVQFIAKDLSVAQRVLPFVALDKWKRDASNNFVCSQALTPTQLVRFLVNRYPQPSFEIKLLIEEVSKLSGIKFAGDVVAASTMVENKDSADFDRAVLDSKRGAEAFVEFKSSKDKITGIEIVGNVVDIRFADANEANKVFKGASGSRIKTTSIQQATAALSVYDKGTPEQQELAYKIRLALKKANKPYAPFPRDSRYAQQAREEGMDLDKKEAKTSTSSIASSLAPASTPKPLSPPLSSSHPSVVRRLEGKGVFQPFRLDFGSEPGDTIRQAKEILRTVRDFKNKGYQKVGITYSANNGQIEQIKKAYDAKKAITGIEGTMQAAVMVAVEGLLATPAYNDLRGVFQILPIATMTYGKELKADAKNIPDSWIDRDLNNIKDFLDGNNVVLGWQNQGSVTSPAHPFAIGGGNARTTISFSPAQKDKVHRQLQRFQAENPLNVNVLPVHPPVKGVVKAPAPTVVAAKLADPVMRANPDGNCAYNAFVLGLCQPSVLQKIEENFLRKGQLIEHEFKDFIAVVKVKFSLPESAGWAEVKQKLLSASASLELQSKLAPFMRVLSISLIEDKKSATYNQHLEGTTAAMLAEFHIYSEQIIKNPTQRVNPVLVGDIFIRHPFISDQFSAASAALNSISGQLTKWWNEVKDSNKPELTADKIFQIFRDYVHSVQLKHHLPAEVKAHPFIEEKFKVLFAENKDALNLEAWWKTAGHAKFLSEMKKPAASAADSHLYAGDLELRVLADYFHVGLKVDKKDMSEGAPAVNYSNGSLVLTDELFGALVQLVDRGIISHEPILIGAETHWPLLPWNEEKVIKLLAPVGDEKVIQEILGKFDAAQEAESLKIDDDLKSKPYFSDLIARSVIYRDFTNDYYWISDRARIANRIKTCPNSESVLASWKASYQDSPNVTVRYTPGHWDAMRAGVAPVAVPPPKGVVIEKKEEKKKEVEAPKAAVKKVVIVDPKEDHKTPNPADKKTHVPMGGAPKKPAIHIPPKAEAKKELAAATSTAKAKGTDVTFFQRINEIKAVVKDDWTMVKHAEFYHVSKNKLSFDIAEKQMTTDDDQPETFVALLEAFKAAHPGRLPEIATTDELRDQWIIACRHPKIGFGPYISLILRDSDPDLAPKPSVSSLSR